MKREFFMGAGTLSENHSVTQVFQLLKAGDEEAANRLWRECFPRLVQHARKKLDGIPRAMADEEDVALSALKSFCKAMGLGRFPDLRDRDDLWRLLFRMTERKAIDLMRYQGRRPARHVLSDDSDERPGNELINYSAAMSEEQFAAELSEELEERLSLLEPEFREYAVAKLEGYTNLEIAKMFDVAERTVERRLYLIRRIWSENRTSGNSEGA